MPLSCWLAMSSDPPHMWCRQRTWAAEAASGACTTAKLRSSKRAAAVHNGPGEAGGQPAHAVRHDPLQMSLASMTRSCQLRCSHAVSRAHTGTGWQSWHAAGMHQCPRMLLQLAMLRAVGVCCRAAASAGGPPHPESRGSAGGEGGPRRVCVTAPKQCQQRAAAPAGPLRAALPRVSHCVLPLIAN